MTISTTFRSIALAGLVIIGLSACTSSKSLMKDGNKFQAAGMHEDAVKSYKASLARKLTNIESRQGLETSGQRVIDGLLDRFNRHNMLEEHGEAVYAFHDVEEFQKEIKKYRVDLLVPSHYYTSYKQSLATHLENLYVEGNTLFEAEEWNKAKVFYDEILSLDQDYKDVEELHGTSVVEPIYRTAVANFEQGRYRDAYYGFEDILHRVDSYKDAADMSRQSREAGQIVMAMLPFENASREPGVEDRVQAYAQSSLINLRDPFLKIVDRQHIDQIIAEQEISISGLIDNSTAVELGNLSGAGVIMIGQVIDFRVNESGLARTKVDAFESYVVLGRDEEGKETRTTKYKPVKYVSNHNDNGVYISFLLKMIDLETSEILISEVIERELGDEVNWGTYSGDYKRLVPNVNGRPKTSRSAVNALRATFTARRELARTMDMANQSYEDMGDAIATRINTFLSHD